MIEIPTSYMNKLKSRYDKFVSVVCEYGLCHGKLKDSFNGYKLGISEFLAQNPCDTIPTGILRAYYNLSIYRRLLSNLFAPCGNDYIDGEIVFGDLLEKNFAPLEELFDVYCNIFDELDYDNDRIIETIEEKSKELSFDDFVLFMQELQKTRQIIES